MLVMYKELLPKLFRVILFQNDAYYMMNRRCPNKGTRDSKNNNFG